MTAQVARRLIVLLALLALACRGVPREASSAEEIALVRGSVYTRSLAAGVARRFRFDVAPDRFLHLGVEQRGVDVVVFLRDPANRLLYEVDGPTGSEGRETVLAVTREAGEHVLIVEPLKAGAGGDFAIEVLEVRPASEEDRLRAAAAAALARADRRRLESEFEPAIAAYREGLPLLAAQSAAEGEIAGVEWHLGEALLAAGELRQAAVILETAAARFGRLGDGVGEARALNDLGAARRLLGDTGRALHAFQRCLGLYRAAAMSDGEATALHNIGLVLETKGDLEGAIAHFEKALALWRQRGARSAEAVTLQSLGSIYALIGHDGEALDLLQRALALLAGKENEDRRVSALISLGWAQYLAGRPVAALERYRQAITLARSRGNRLAEAGAWGRRGSALRALGRFREAADSYRRALAMSRAAGNRLSEGHTLANLGWLDLETGAVARGRQRLAQAVELLAASGDPNGEVYARVGLSRAERRRGAFGPAREQIDAAIRLVEEVHTGLRGPLSRGQFLATRYDAFEELVALLMELERREPAKGHALRALEVAERARARNLLESTPGDRESAPEVTEAAGRKRALLAEIRVLDERRQLLAAGNAREASLRNLDAALRRRWLELDRLAAAPLARTGPASLDAREIQALADEGTVLVVYLLAEPESFAWTVDREHVEAHVLPGRERIERLARRVIAAMPGSHQVATEGAAIRAATALSRAILVPLGQRLAGKQRLVILADGALHLVPFAALPAPGPGQSAKPLLVDYEIVLVPSATFVDQQRRRLAGRAPAPWTVAVLADPLLSAVGSRGGQASPVQLPGRGLELGPLEPLPWTAEEAEAIARLVPRRERLVALGPRANRDLVTSGALARYRIIHFATHGLVHPVLPERSGIVLSLFDEEGRRRDGFLSAPEVAALDLPAELVVLSACETGLGRELRGEGLVGLTQAFFHAGTRRTVVSYWKVRDRATAELMARFYRYLLAEGLPPAAALRAAQLSIRSEPDWHSPFFWAGFSLHGDWQ